MDEICIRAIIGVIDGNVFGSFNLFVCLSVGL